MAAASSVAVSANWILSFVISYSTPYIIDGLGSLWFLPFEGFIFLGTVFCYLLVPETKGRPMSYISQPKISPQ